MRKRAWINFLVLFFIAWIVVIVISSMIWNDYRTLSQFIGLVGAAGVGTAAIFALFLAIYVLKKQGETEKTIDLNQTKKKYLGYLLDTHTNLSLRGIGPAENVPLKLPLLDLYVPLKAHLQLPEWDTWQRLQLAGRNLNEGEEKRQNVSKPQPVLDLLKVKENAALVLLGDPGAGKTTFLKFLALRLALGHGQDLGLGNRLPVLMPLAAYANALQEKDIRLDQFIGEYFCNTCDELPVQDLLRNELEKGTALVLLDGLDEVKELSLRGTVVTRVMDFYNTHRRAGNKFVITSRVIGYREVRPVGDGLLEGMLTDFDDEEIAEFVQRWTVALEKLSQGESQVAKINAETEKRELLEAVQRNAGVRRLAANPLLLTILALMKRKGVTLPERRVQLYDQYVSTMLSIWNRARSISGRSVGKELDVLETVRILAPLALWMHEENPGAGLVKKEDMRRKLEQIYRQRGSSDPEKDARNLIEDVHENTALLLERGAGEYGFIHLTFEEYLAAVGIALQGQGNVERIAGTLTVYVDKPAWREVIILTVAYVGLIQQLESVAGAVVEKMAGTGAEPLSIILAGEAVADAGMSGVPAASKEVVIQALLPVMRGSEVNAAQRCRAGNTLARLGDPRFRADLWHLPDEPLLGFVEIPAGFFWMGSDGKKNESPKHEVELPTYYMARYPVTVAQFRDFVEKSGYIQHDPDCLKGLPNHPVVRVTWHNALAYCHWLDEELHRAENLPYAWRDLLAKNPTLHVTLPSEAEWEKAARGTDGRNYPWGEEFDSEKANINETKIGGTTAVGCFPGGASPYGVLEMSGNVWEWTHSLYMDYPYKGNDGREKLDKSGSRVLRGGALYDDLGIARCAYRRWGRPDLRFSDLGFRPAVVL